MLGRGKHVVLGMVQLQTDNGSWNKNLAYDRGLYMGGEFRTKGVNVALGPVVGPLGRVATGGRNWEGISNDPYLCGSLAAATSRGIQSSGVIACAKVGLQSYRALPQTNNILALYRERARDQSPSSGEFDHGNFACRVSLCKHR